MITDKVSEELVSPVRTGALVVEADRIFVGFRQDLVENEAEARTKRPVDLAARIIATLYAHMKHLWTKGLGDAVAAEQTVPWLLRQSLLHPDSAIRIYGIQFHSLGCKKKNGIFFRRPSSQELAK